MQEVVQACWPAVGMQGAGKIMHLGERHDK